MIGMLAAESAVVSCHVMAMQRERRPLCLATCVERGTCCYSFEIMRVSFRQHSKSALEIHLFAELGNDDKDD
jgi:hypothetical protein